MAENDDVVIVGYVEHDEIRLDDHNANLGTERGMDVIERSLDKYGAGRSILIDRNNVDIAGNKTLEKWVAKGGKVFVVETDGQTLIAVRRRDMAVDEDPAARELATIDNRAAELNLSWNYDELVALADVPNIDLSVGFTTLEIEDMRLHTEMPDIGAVSASAGQNTDDDYTVPFKLMVAPDLVERYKALVDDLDESESDAFAQVLEWAERGRDAI